MNENFTIKNTGFRFNRIALLGMSGLGKTFISRKLLKNDYWHHYSVDYEIGKILFTKQKKYLMDGFHEDNLTNLSNFLGKPGSFSMGGISFTEYIKHQRLHKKAEISSTLRACAEIEESPNIKNFICDTSGSICELVDPKNRNDNILNSLSKNFLIICIKAPDKIYTTLIQRFISRPKPMYFQETFLNNLWDKYLSETGKDPCDINPDEFMLYGFKALIERRKKIFEEISEHWGISLSFDQLTKIETSTDLMKAIELQLQKK